MSDASLAGGTPVILDTDIGSDVDDLLALVLLANERSVDLLGVATVYGDVMLRAQLARRALRLLGRDDVPVHVGEERPLSGRDVWWGGHEGDGVDGLAGEEISAVGGVDALLAAARRHPGELVVVAIGPLTNVATALRREPSWASQVRRLVIMGGEFARGEPEHNLRSDDAAAATVLGAGIPSTYVGLDVTTTVPFDDADLDAVTASGSAGAMLVDAQVRRWWQRLGSSSCHPHDPLAVLAMLEPSLFSWRAGGWKVIEDGPEAGALISDPSTASIDYATTVDVTAARDSLRSRISTALLPSATS
ncbi:nucleoside hydrolase [Phytoactinopolyspora halotolerans]|uniref:Nucleoside hydrolase n=1 Tax=Phytoactinopolyspora halotolerans TaxID=1981512 RepID=A0A6L9S311_9ACTN|nr:nucleoside hydrolase [Phytoactinopolyspora halotolerans]NED99438.1 nucleoside hydrolase [Phytoactinopolyspora halotolerans]